ncbi:hypothetical protein LCGC14_0200270 [marine sediment metagenome]|uniref:Uncharacterized protein n=1 Tax=marine sediment metagenome TaxID=412755 RepID=A0A0F9V061_9ZZZZ
MQPATRKTPLGRSLCCSKPLNFSLHSQSDLAVIH